MEKNTDNKYLLLGLVGFASVTAALLLGIFLGQRDIVNLGTEETAQVVSNTESSAADDNLPKDLDYSSVEDVYDLLRSQYDGDLDEQELLSGLKAGLARATGDPYTEFFDAEDAVEFNNELEGTFTGIGAELERKNGSVVVVSPLDGFPAEAAGLRANDIIVAINGEDSTDMTVGQAVSLIRGPEGEDVTLSVVRNQSELLDITITRAVIDAPNVRWRVEDGVGVIRVSRFAQDVRELTEQAAEDLKKQGVTKFILDLRGNPGGFLDQAVYLSGLWIDDGQTIVEVRRGGEVQQTLKSEGNQELSGLQTVVLINAGSASASEIVAGALQDYGLATVIGQTSFGKGSVQTPQKLDDGELLKVTTARWFTPNGQNIDGEGITPDIEIELSEDDYETGNDPQLEKAKQELKQ
ncbi:MAG: S41 family peptidase [Patescibacteria group bacterium]